MQYSCVLTCMISIHLILKRAAAAGALGLKGPSRARTFQEDASYVERVKRKEQANQGEQTRAIAKNKHAKLVLNVIWEGSGEGEGNMEFLDDSVQVN